MICEEFNINNALGVRIFNELRVGSVFLEKGHVLSDDDIAALKLLGINKIFGAKIQEKDVTVENALGIICAKLCGAHTSYSINSGVAKISAAREGFFVVSEDRIAKFNRLSHNVILNTIAPYSFVQEGEVIAELEITMPLLEHGKIEEIIFKLSGNVELLSVSKAQPRRAALIYTKLYNDAVETRHITSVVKKIVSNFSALGLEFDNEYDTPHTINDLSDTVERAIREGNEVIFVVSAQRNACELDVVPASLKSIVDEFLVFNIPQVGLSDLVIASKRSAKIVNVPYAYSSIDSKIADQYIKQAIINQKQTAYDFNRPQNVEIAKNIMLSEEERKTLISANNRSLNTSEANIAAIVLAAGLGSRAGRNKLLLDINGEPLFMNAVRAAVKSKASPVFVITGYNAQEIEEYLDDVDVNIIYNSSYRAGVRTSINLGLKSVPNFCDAVILLPADMPNITEEHLNKMIKSFKKGEPKQLVMTRYKDTKTNPVLWSNALYDYADIVPENAHLRPIFMEHVDYTKYTDVKSPEAIIDITYPSDIEMITK